MKKRIRSAKQRLVLISILLSFIMGISVSAETAKTPVTKIPDINIAKTTSAPKVDGKISSGEYPSKVYTLNSTTANRIFGTPRSETNAEIYMTYDDSRLYIAVKTPENGTHIGTDEAAGMWQGDCLQFYFLMVDPAKYKYSTHRMNYQTKMGVSATSDFKKQNLVRWVAAKGKGASGVDYGHESGLVGDDFSESSPPPVSKTLKSGSVIIYEVSIPWSVLTPQDVSSPKQGDVVGMSLALVSTNHAGEGTGFSSLELGQAVVDNNIMKTARIILGAAASTGEKDKTTTSAVGTTTAKQNQGGEVTTTSSAPTDIDGETQPTETTPTDIGGETQPTETQNPDAILVNSEELKVTIPMQKDGRISGLLFATIALGVLILGCAGLLIYLFLDSKKPRVDNNVDDLDN